MKITQSIIKLLHIFFKKISVDLLLKYKNQLEKEIQINKAQLLSAYSESSNKKSLQYYEDLALRNKDLQNLINIKENQLLEFKLAQQKANTLKHPDGKTNFYYIYKLSNLTQTRRSYDSLLAKTTGNKKMIILNILNNIIKEINDIERKLEQFNHKNKIYVKLNSSLSFK